MAIDIVGTGQPEGTSLGKSTTELVGLYGVVKAQAAHITDAVVATGTTADNNSGTAASCAASVADHAALMAIINTLLDDLSDIGVIASS